MNFLVDFFDLVDRRLRILAASFRENGKYRQKDVQLKARPTDLFYQFGQVFQVKLLK